jgi:hypothetical protein
MIMKILVIISLILTCLGMSSTVTANGIGTVTALLVGRLGNQVFVKISGSVDSVRCRTRTDWHYFLDLTSPGAKEIYSALLTAKATNQNVTIQSTGTCDSTGQNLEQVAYVILN